MTEAAHRQDQTGPIVWVLSTGEDHEGGAVLGVYASKNAAKGPFVEAAKRIPFDLDRAWQDEESGAVHAHGGCDWVALEPHPLITSAQIGAQMKSTACSHCHSKDGHHVQCPHF